MAYKIPDSKEVSKVIKDVIGREGVVGSQYKLRKIVEKELKNIDPSYSISGRRVRVLAIGSKNVSVGIHTKEGEEITTMSICPVCSSKLKSIKNKTLYNWEVTVGYRCRKCKYWTGKKRRIPTRYVFEKR
ncbi:MAG: hypothetical protein QMC80_08335 [Thermoplasmatales archaeon]|nr:hypothetical protein [Thermoplasmatales archaeon]